MSSAAYEEGEVWRKTEERVHLENWIFKKHKEQEFCIVVNVFDFTKEVHREWDRPLWTHSPRENGWGKKFHASRMVMCFFYIYWIIIPYPHSIYHGIIFQLIEEIYLIPCKASLSLKNCFTSCMYFHYVQMQHIFIGLLFQNLAILNASISISVMYIYISMLLHN